MFIGRVVWVDIMIEFSGRLKGCGIVLFDVLEDVVYVISIFWKWKSVFMLIKKLFD